MYTRAMPDASADWVVGKHGPLEKVSENLWRVEGAVPRGPIRRVMTVARLTNGDLVIHSAIALEESAMKELEQLGTPRYLIVPNGFHRIDAPRFKKRYPAIRVVCPKGATKRVADAVAVDGGFELLPDDPRLRVEMLEGSGDREAVLIVKDGAETTLIFNDVVFNMPHATGFGGFVLKHLTKSSGGPCVSRIARAALVKDNAKVRAHLERLAQLDGLARAIVSHHEVITGDVAAQLRAVAATL